MDSTPLERQMVQKFEETSWERADREKAGFPTMESSLSHLKLDFKVPALTGLSSLLGKRNPLASAVKPGEDVVWLLDNTAYKSSTPSSTGAAPSWRADFVAAYFAQNSGQDTSKWIAEIAQHAGLDSVKDMTHAEGEKRIAQRLEPFLDVIRPAKFVSATFPSGKVEKLGPGARDGISTDTKALKGQYSDGDVAETSISSSKLLPHGPMLTHFADPKGWLVVSDIDDTIKITMTPSPAGILQTTFLSDPTPIKGQPELYAHIHQALKPAWFYLSASPYNLYPFLRTFLHNNYPKGTLILRNSSWQDLGGFLQALTQGTEAYKASRIERIHGWLPDRKTLCVGDSTQSDPEAYGDIYRKHPGFVKAIFIRRVTGVAEMDEKTKNAPERFEKAFKDVPKEIWKVFDDPKELFALVDELKKSEA